MPLVDHLRELRYRVILSAVVVVIATTVCAFFYKRLIELTLWPYTVARAQVLAAVPDADLLVVNTGVTAPFVLALRVSLVAGVIASCPVWLYQVWAFIAPALMAKEKRNALIFLSASVPLFLAGALLSFLVMPQAVSLMLQFTPPGMGISNLLDINVFLGLELTLMMVFGLAFLLPVVLITLNVVGVLRGVQLGRARSVAIFVSFVFAAFVTPSTDPFTMIALALPISVLYLVAEVVCRLRDRRAAAIGADEFAVQL